MKTRLIIWFIICLASSIIFFGELWVKLPQWLSPEGLQRYGVFHWGVLGLCVLWLWLKRKDILSRIQTARLSLPFILAGMALVALSSGQALLGLLSLQGNNVSLMYWTSTVY